MCFSKSSGYKVNSRSLANKVTYFIGNYLNELAKSDPIATPRTTLSSPTYHWQLAIWRKCLNCCAMQHGIAIRSTIGPISNSRPRPRPIPNTKPKPIPSWLIDRAACSLCCPKLFIYFDTFSWRLRLLPLLRRENQIKLSRVFP